jgi:hypothetical protein
MSVSILVDMNLSEEWISGIQTPKKSRSEQSSCTSHFRSLEAV